MRLLDCSTFETTRETVSQITGVPAEAMTDMLRSLRLDESSVLSRGEQTALAVFGTLGTVPQPDCVCWFHATRIRRGTTFHDGLLPTNGMWPRLEAQLRELADQHGLCPESEWEHLPRIGSNASRLAWKAGAGSFDKGPHGFLMRDTILNPGRTPVADYTETPEIVREMCYSIPAVIGIPLLKLYQDITCRAIVKFQSSLLVRGTIEAALRYLYEQTVEGELSNSYGFDAQGVAIPGRDVLGVEYLE